VQYSADGTLGFHKELARFGGRGGEWAEQRRSDRRSGLRGSGGEVAFGDGGDLQQSDREEGNNHKQPTSKGNNRWF
jgi:hypothetical protein